MISRVLRRGSLIIVILLVIYCEGLCVLINLVVYCRKFSLNIVYSYMLDCNVETSLIYSLL